jgi:nitroimidazol reductase NimA-like FMN-containing flavoprotein (pyridoxamine 5'-phosphate oxidase superfamily)
MRKMSHDVLERHIIKFLKEHNMCVLATCNDNIPRATPLEYHSQGTTLYFVGEPGMKIKNIRRNPNVSIGIFSQYVGWNSAKGAQITGKAKIISRKNAIEFKEGLAAYQWEKTAAELGIQSLPETVELIKIEPERIEFIDMSLKKKGFDPCQEFKLSA